MRFYDPCFKMLQKKIKKFYVSEYYYIFLLKMLP